MNNWLETLIGTVVIGGVVAIASHQAKKQGYIEGVQHCNQNAQDREIANLRAELEYMKSQQVKSIA